MLKRPSSFRKVNLRQFETNQESIEAFKTATRSFVQLYMGPYEANGIIRHRIQRLKGLQDALSKSGYSTELVPTMHLNRFSMVFYDREIFRCNIRSFQFNIPAEEDPFCKTVLEILQEHESRFFKDENIPKFVNVDYGMRFIKMNKRMTTADMFTASDIKLLYEVKPSKLDVEEPENLLSPRVMSHLSSTNSGHGYNIGDEKVSFQVYKEEKEKEKAEMQAQTKPSKDTNTETGTANQERKSLVSSVQIDIDYDMTYHQNVFDRATRNMRIIRASYMFKSGQIQSVDTGKSFGPMIPDLRAKYDKPEIKNQKLIAKVLQLKKERKSNKKLIN